MATLRKSGNDQDLLIKYSERWDVDDPPPKGLLNGKGKIRGLSPFSLSATFPWRVAIYLRVISNIWLVKKGVIASY